MNKFYVQNAIKFQVNKRTGWINNDVPNPESISDHMYRMAIMAMLLNDKQLNTLQLVVY